MKKKLILIIGAIAVAALGAICCIHTYKKTADPLCKEAMAFTKAADRGNFQVLQLKNFSHFCMQALGEKVNFKISDTLTAEINFEGKSSYYFLTSRGMKSPRLRLNYTESTLGNTASFFLALPNEEANNMLSRKEIHLVPDKPSENFHELALRVDSN